MNDIEKMIKKAEDMKDAAKSRLTVGDLRKTLEKYDDETVVCIYAKMECFYEPLREIRVKSVKPHYDVYADRSHKFIPEYQEELNKIPSCNVLALFY